MYFEFCSSQKSSWKVRTIFSKLAQVLKKSLFIKITYFHVIPDCMVKFQIKIEVMQMSAKNNTILLVVTTDLTALSLSFTLCLAFFLISFFPLFCLFYFHLNKTANFAKCQTPWNYIYRVLQSYWNFIQSYIVIW